MNRIIFSAIGVILTFAWIVYTAPNKSGVIASTKDLQIKKINKSGATSLHHIKEPQSRVIIVQQPGSKERSERALVKAANKIID